MSDYEKITSILALGTLMTGAGTIAIAWISNQTNKRIAKRQGVIELHNAWAIVNDIDTEDIITPDVVNCVNALTLTASLWNHDVLEKELLYQSYWEIYKMLTDKIGSISEKLPGRDFTGESRITSDIVKAYRQMENMNNMYTKSTKI